jgi:hypothetical protein
MTRVEVRMTIIIRRDKNAEPIGLLAELLREPEPEPVLPAAKRIEIKRVQLS